YGDTFTGTADNYRTGIGVAELGFKATSTSKYKIGYIRTVTPTSLYKFMGVNRAFIRWDQMAFGRVTLSTQLDGTLLTYGNAVATADDLGQPIMTTSGRMDFNINFKTVLSVEINQNFSVSLSETFTTKISNGETSVGNVGYTSNDIFLRLSGRY
ncbi:hypothetical protein KAI87_12940, partial [Myxococcota bacterium]|nr:hypothetical protein [Myxococcota bacterium]